MTGINARKIIQNLQVLYNLAPIFPLPNLVGVSFFFCDLENGTKLLPPSPAGRGGAVDSHRVALQTSMSSSLCVAIGMSSTNAYIVPLAMLAIALTLLAAALWL
jgi:hypothetical protein